jgi:hypothetical protein
MYLHIPSSQQPHIPCNIATYYTHCSLQDRAYSHTYYSPLQPYISFHIPVYYSPLLHCMSCNIAAIQHNTTVQQSSLYLYILQSAARNILPDICIATFITVHFSLTYPSIYQHILQSSIALHLLSYTYIYYSPLQPYIY